MQSYNAFQKFLHDLVLGNKFINKSLFEIEKIIFLKNINVKDNQHLFITSLPRSGTTSLLNFIFSSDEYVSLIYKNVPFVMSPHLAKLFNNKKIPKKERLHSDGITFDLESPEALDEIFFNDNEEFLRSELLNYISLILLSGSKNKYLSKNNLNYKRIGLIHSLLPKSSFIIPIREPLQHAYSLLSQHLHFSKIQQKNAFIRRYMNYLGHNEFGLDHRSWNDAVYFTKLQDINYWLEQWYLFYLDIIERYKNHDKCFFVVYERLTNPTYLENFLGKINAFQGKEINIDFFKNSNRKNIEIQYDRHLYAKATDLYRSLFNKN